jgi:hypothetical protein
MTTAASLPEPKQENGRPKGEDPVPLRGPARSTTERLLHKEPES